MILYQLVSQIIELELINHLGGTVPGNNKVRTRILYTINAELAEEMECLLNNSQSEAGRKAILGYFDKLISCKYSEVMANSKFPALNQNYIWDEKIAISTSVKSEVTNLINTLRPFIEENKCHIYFQLSPYIKQQGEYHLLVIKGNSNFLLNEIIPIVHDVAKRDCLISPSNFPLLEIFNGGPDILSLSEEFYIYLSESIMGIKNISSTPTLSDIDKYNLAATILFLYSKVFNAENNISFSFCEYIFDQWLPYSYVSLGQNFNEILNFQKKILIKLEARYLNEYEVFEYMDLHINNLLLKDDDENPHLNILHRNLKKMASQTKSNARFIADFDLKIISIYSDNEESQLWYIYRRQLESIFSILDIDNQEWGYFAYIIKTLAIRKLL